LQPSPPYLLPAIRADTIADHQVTQSRPIQLGTSGGNLNDESAQFCCSGTLGALVQDRKGRLYILSNNHVLARTNRGHKRELITQPGLVDANCMLGTDAAVAALTKRLGIHFGMHSKNVMDAAIAQVLPGDVDPSGNIVGIGTLGTGTVDPVVGLAVQKSGRTSGVTHGVIAAVEVSILVTYDKQCGVGSQTAAFLHQIRITPGAFGDFSQGGDSGSIVVEDTNTCPRVVGLLFAGGGGDTFANPIEPILSKLKVTIVGCGATSNAVGVVRTQAMPLQKGGMASSRFLACKAAKESVETNLLGVAGIVGMGIGLGGSESNAPSVEIYSTAEPSEIRSKLPVSLNSVPLKIIRTGTIHAL
jgi:hypothetical protein